MSATATAMLETPPAKEYFGDNLDTNEKLKLNNVKYSHHY